MTPSFSRSSTATSADAIMELWLVIENQNCRAYIYFVARLSHRISLIPESITKLQEFKA